MQLLGIILSMGLGALLGFIVAIGLDIEGWLNFRFEKRVIVDCQRDPYLHRWYLFQSKRLGIYIHKFARSDEDRALHDHPWDFIVIPIWRGYIEHSEQICYHRPEECFMCSGVCKTGTHIRLKRVLPIIGIRYRMAEYKHRVELLRSDCDCWRCATDHPWGPKPNHQGEELPAWSIFIRFTKRREWGFAAPEGWIHWNKWWQEKCED